MGKYEDYMNQLGGVQPTAFDQSIEGAPGALQTPEPTPPSPQSTAPSASQGALPGEAAPAAEPAFTPAEEQQQSMEMGMNTANKQAPAKDFFQMWKESSPDDRELATSNFEEVPASQGKSLEGMMQEAYLQNPMAAKEIGAKYGFTPPGQGGGTMPDFKLEQRALAGYGEMHAGAREAFAKGDEALKDIEKANTEGDAAAKIKQEKRHAMGGFLFEMGLRILASNREDAGGAIGEGVLGTMEARQNRKIAAEDRDIAEEDRIRTRGFEDSQEARLIEDAERKKSAEGRAQAEEERQKEIHEARKNAGTLALGSGQGKTAFQIQQDAYMEAFAPPGKTVDDMTPEEAKKLRQDFLGYYNRSDRLTKKDRATLIERYSNGITEGSIGYDGDGNWDDMTIAERNDYIVTQVPWLSGDDSVENSNPLQLDLATP